MSLGAVIRKSHNIVAIALTLMMPAGAFAAQQTAPVQSAPIQPNQGNRAVQANQPVVIPPVNGPKVAPPPIPAPVVPPAPVVSPPVVTPPPAPKPRKKGPIDDLKPGQFIWITQDAYEGTMKIVVVLDIQRIYVFQNDKLIGFSTISSGKKGKETPSGYFTILQKNIDHKSNIYSNAPMPFMQRLTWDGIALHGGQILGYPASHGCIRLPQAFAKALYGVTKLDQEVYVLRDTATPVKKPEPKPVVLPPQPPVDPVSTQPTAPSTTQPPFPPEPSD